MSFKPGDIVYPIYNEDLTRTMKTFVGEKCTINYASLDGSAFTLKEDSNGFLWCENWLSAHPPIEIDEIEFELLFMGNE